MHHGCLREFAGGIAITPNRLGSRALAVAALLVASPATEWLATFTQEPPVAAREPAGPAAAPAPKIEWMDWSDTAFERSRLEGKPILLNVRALWSRTSLWVEEKVYTDPQVVKLVNERWIPIRVDRDRRPDIDLRYQLAINAVAPGESGWPLTAFLFDSGEVLSGRSYVSVEDRRGKAGLRSLLEKTADFHGAGREQTAGTRQVVMMAFEREQTLAREPFIGAGVLEQIGGEMISKLDPERGGFGDGSKAPMPYSLELAATLHHRSGRPAFLDVLVKTLHGMERGAIFDRVGGGFHRSTTDPAWRVPEFEKLLNYNAALLGEYLVGYEATGDIDFRNTAESILDYLLGTLRDPRGGFYVAQWAASVADDPKGSYYSWTDEEFMKAIPPVHEKIARTIFNITPEGDLVLGPPPRGLLYLTMGRKEAAQRLDMTESGVHEAEAAILSALEKARSARTAPPVEKAIYVDSSAAAISALFDSYRVLDRKDALDAALVSLDRLLAAIPKAGPLQHRVHPPPEPGVDPTLALDHLMLARASLAGYETTGRADYLRAARDLMDRAVALFWDAEGGGFFDIVKDPASRGYLSIRRRLPNDTAYPALNSLAARVLERLVLHTGEPSYRAKAEASLKGLIARAKQLDHRSGGLGLGIDAYLRPATRYVVVGGLEDPKAKALDLAARRIFDPGKLVVRLVAGADDQKLARLGIKKKDGAFAVVCRADRCSEPALDEVSLKERALAPAGSSAGS